jgi:hypothetical protein
MNFHVIIGRVVKNIIQYSFEMTEWKYKKMLLRVFPTIQNRNTIFLNIFQKTFSIDFFGHTCKQLVIIQFFPQLSCSCSFNDGPLFLESRMPPPRYTGGAKHASKRMFMSSAKTYLLAIIINIAGSQPLQ